MYSQKHLSRSFNFNTPKNILKQSRRWSSTGTLFIDHTLSIPDNEHIVESFSTMVHQILHTTRTGKYYIIFDERKFPLGDGKCDFDDLPDIIEISNFLELLALNQEICSDVVVTACAYVDRLISYTSTSFTGFNWRRILLAAILVADKVCEEAQIWNCDYLRSLPYLDLTDINHLERAFLGLIRYDLLISPSLYATYYFGLRAILGLSNLPLYPLRKKEMCLSMLVPLDSAEWGLEKEVVDWLSKRTERKQELAKVRLWHETRVKSEGFSMEGVSSPVMGIEEFRNTRKGLTS